MPPCGLLWKNLRCRREQEEEEEKDEEEEVKGGGLGGNGGGQTLLVAVLLTSTQFQIDAKVSNIYETKAALCSSNGFRRDGYYPLDNTVNTCSLIFI